MVAIKNVVIAGASGNLGPVILKSLVDSGKFNITVLKRASSKAITQSGIKTADVDFDSISSLTAILKGQDAVVSTLSTTSGSAQANLIDAAVAAGVHRFLPSEFGSDLDNPKTKAAAFLVFDAKVATNKKLAELAETNPSFTYTLIRNNAFLDWGLKVGFLLNTQSENPAIYNSGDDIYSATNLSTIGQAVVGVLDHPDETANRAVYIKDLDISQNKLLAIAKRVFPEKNFQPEHVASDDLLKKSYEELKAGNITRSTFVNLIVSAAFVDGYGGKIEKTDNELLGIKEFKEENLEQLWKDIVSGKHQV